jgi:aminoglycoside/choline kinase family phosphotransferase
MAAARQFIAESGYSEALRAQLKGDASTRLYERLTLGDKHVILMNSPRRPDGPPVRDGKPYSAIAHLADNVIPFVAMANGLRQAGFSAPIIHHADLDQGLLIIGDLGERIVSGGPRGRSRSATRRQSMRCLLHEHKLPDVLPVSPHVVRHRIPTTTLTAFLIEAELLLDWVFCPASMPRCPTASGFVPALWRNSTARDRHAPYQVLRDYHSPNLLWLPRLAGSPGSAFSTSGRGDGAGEPMTSHRSCRTRASTRLRAGRLRAARPHFRARPAPKPTRFRPHPIHRFTSRWRRSAPADLGIFARLDMRDGKPQYLRHMPRICRGYLQRSLSHPSLEALSAWYIAHVPALNTI